MEETFFHSNKATFVVEAQKIAFLMGVSTGQKRGNKIDLVTDGPNFFEALNRRCEPLATTIAEFHADNLGVKRSQECTLKFKDDLAALFNDEKYRVAFLNAFDVGQEIGVKINANPGRYRNDVKSRLTRRVDNFEVIQAILSGRILDTVQFPEIRQEQNVSVFQELQSSPTITFDISL